MACGLWVFAVSQMQYASSQMQWFLLYKLFCYENHIMSHSQTVTLMQVICTEMCLNFRFTILPNPENWLKIHEKWVLLILESKKIQFLNKWVNNFVFKKPIQNFKISHLLFSRLVTDVSFNFALSSYLNHQGYPIQTCVSLSHAFIKLK